MADDWEATFRAWSKPSSDTEQAKCEHAEMMIREAIGRHGAFANCNLEVFAQGSYRNNTNVRLESDVDICVLSRDVVFSDFSNAQGFSEVDVGSGPAPYSYTEFKAEVGNALVAKFGIGGVSRGNKAFDVHQNSYRVDADLVACFEHRRYLSRHPLGGFHYLSGTQLIADNGGVVINWPQQHYDSGVAKNTVTGNRYKWITRALKRLRNHMADKGIIAARRIPSFLIECLAWNVSNDAYGHARYTDDVRAVLAGAFNATIDDAGCERWTEVSGLKWLFTPTQPWTRQQAHAFLDAGWDYVGFE